MNPALKTEALTLATQGFLEFATLFRNEVDPVKKEEYERWTNMFRFAVESFTVVSHCEDEEPLYVLHHVINRRNSLEHIYLSCVNWFQIKDDNRFLIGTVQGDFAFNCNETEKEKLLSAFREVRWYGLNIKGEYCYDPCYFRIGKIKSAVWEKICNYDPRSPVTLEVKFTNGDSVYNATWRTDPEDLKLVEVNNL